MDVVRPEAVSPFPSPVFNVPVCALSRTMDDEIDGLVASFSRLHIGSVPLLPAAVAVDRPSLPPHQPHRGTDQHNQVLVDPGRPYTTIHRRQEEKEVVQLSSERNAWNSTTHYQQTVTVSTVVNNIQRVENSTFGANYGNQALIQATSRSDRRALDSLPAHPDVSGLLSSYLEDSRTGDIEYALHWISLSQELVLWIHAPAGMGKSTFARELAEKLRSKGQLAAALFLSFAPADWGPETMIRLIAGEIGRIHPRAIPSIADAIESYGGPSLPLDVLFDQYIRRPIQSLQLPHPLIILTDAIDEWKMYPTLIKQFTTIDSSRDLVKFIILGRAVPSERDFPGVSMSLYPLPPASKEVISRYFHAHFATIDWGKAEKPEERQVSQLAEKANGLFVWAWIVFSTIADDFIDASPKEILEQTLESRRTTGDSELLAELYHGAIMRSFPRAREREQVRKYLQAIFVLESPLPIADFAKLIGMEPRTVEHIRKGLYALQTRNPDGTGELMYPATAIFHLSVTEYFQSDSTPEDYAFSVSVSEGHALVGGGCLRLLPKMFLASSEDALQSDRRLYDYIALTWPGHVAGSYPSLVANFNAEIWKHFQLHGPLQRLTRETVHGWTKALRSTINVDCPLNVAHLEQAETGVLLRLLGTKLSEGDNTKSIHLGVACLELAVRLLPQAASSWHNLGRAHRELAKFTRSRQSVETAIAIHRHAVEVVCVIDPGAAREEVKRDLARSLRSTIWYHQLTAVSEELDEAISLGRDAVQQLEHDEDERARWLHNLASSMVNRFDITSSIEDLEEGITRAQEALELRPEGHRDRADVMHHLAGSFAKRFGLTSSLADLHESIRLCREALKLRPKGYRTRADILHNLAKSLGRRSIAMSSLEDSEESVRLHREALELRPKGHQGRAWSLQNLAVALATRFRVTPSLEDLEESVRLHQEALELRPEGHEDRVWSLQSLSVSLATRFRVTASRGDVEESVQLDREALKLRPEGHRDRIWSLHNLAVSLATRFSVTRSLEDSEEIIRLYRVALTLRPEGHRDRARSLYNLVLALRRRFGVTSSLADLEESIELDREALNLRPEGHQDRAQSLSSLAISLSKHFVAAKMKSLNNLDESIRLHREALILRPGSHPDRYKSLWDLGHTLNLRSRATSNIEDIHEAISANNQALELCPPSAPTDRQVLQKNGSIFAKFLTSLSSTSRLETETA
ncbi:hypothetical protein FA13DRAFT_1739211 [Coprinellus micaceus]|uniref:Nephrocystin 3-like N-terminal domain-containing protein n=1 Tax=Coprinellus micaceus TaxID=71717 RepID=A0A4Y7SRL7_COPMI|nr:hypothetical protein FA13DRAFT_1739211 [Coprinellus micaceus]